MIFSVALIVCALFIAGCAASPQMPLPTAGDVERGAQLFRQGRAEIPSCSTCHLVMPGQVGFSLGPNLAGISERAETRSEGLAANEYLLQSIVEPQRYIVDGYRDMMYSKYDAHLNEQDLLDLLAYLLTL
jgi:mono/diheme cytochrome c family protein